LAARSGLERIVLANDWAAAAAGAAAGDPGVLAPLADGAPLPGAPVLALGAGTGLGAGYAAETSTGLTVFPAEAGHAAFAPRDADEDVVLALLRREQAYVSYESVLSGRGLVAIHRALCERAGVTWPASTGPEISAAATETGPDRPHARAAAELFLAVLGTFAGSAAVILGARGGVCVGGGVVEALAPLLSQSRFLDRFHDLGPMSAYTRAIPVFRIVDTVGATLRGAARLAG
jgi:glucokinase